MGILPDTAQLYGQGYPGRRKGSEAGRRKRSERDNHGTAQRRQAHDRDPAYSPGALGQRAGEANACRMGLQMARKHAGSHSYPERHELRRTASAEYRYGFSRRPQRALRRRKRTHRQGLRRIQQTHQVLLHGMRVLSAMSSEAQDT